MILHEHFLYVSVDEAIGSGFSVFKLVARLLCCVEPSAVWCFHPIPCALSMLKLTGLVLSWQFSIPRIYHVTYEDAPPLKSTAASSSFQLQSTLCMDF